MITQITKLVEEWGYDVVFGQLAAAEHGILTSHAHGGIGSWLERRGYLRYAKKEGVGDCWWLTDKGAPYLKIMRDLALEKLQKGTLKRCLLLVDQVGLIDGKLFTWDCCSERVAITSSDEEESIAQFYLARHRDAQFKFALEVQPQLGDLVTELDVTYTWPEAHLLGEPMLLGVCYRGECRSTPRKTQWLSQDRHPALCGSRFVCHACLDRDDDLHYDEA